MGWRVGSRSRKRVGESSAGVGVSALPGDPSEYSSVNTNSNQKKQNLPLPIITSEELYEDFTSCQYFTLVKWNSDRYCGPSFGMPEVEDQTLKIRRILLQFM